MYFVWRSAGYGNHLSGRSFNLYGDTKEKGALFMARGSLVTFEMNIFDKPLARLFDHQQRPRQIATVNGRRSTMHDIRPR